MYIYIYTYCIYIAGATKTVVKQIQIVVRWLTSVLNSEIAVNNETIVEWPYERDVRGTASSSRDDCAPSIYLSIYLSLSLSIYIYIYMYIYIYTCIYVHTCVYMYMRDREQQQGRLRPRAVGVERLRVVLDAACGPDTYICIYIYIYIYVYMYTCIHIHIST